MNVEGAVAMKAIRGAFSGLTSAFKPAPKGNRGAAHTLWSAQQRADEAWKRTTHGAHSPFRSKDPKP
jgi:hypothetical protein